MEADKKKLKRQAMADIAVVADALRRWDPIGVLPGHGAPMDEYDSYAPQLLSVLMRGCNAEELEEQLIRIRVDWMGLKPYPPSDSKIAAELVAWWRSKSQQDQGN